MKLYLGLFVAALSMPVSFLAGYFSYRLHIATDISQAFAQAALVMVILLAVSLLLFLTGIPSTMKRLKAQHQQGGV